MGKDSGIREVGDMGHPAAVVDTGTAAARKGEPGDMAQVAADIHSQQDYWADMDKAVAVAAHKDMDTLVEAAVRRGPLALDCMPPVSGS